MTQTRLIETPQTRLAMLGHALPVRAPAPVGAFDNARRHGDLLFVSGQGPVREDGSLAHGKVGLDVSAEEARAHAELVTLNLLAVVNDKLGGLDGVGAVVKLVGLVNATPDFERHPFVIDGASELLHAVFGADGVHACTSYGVASLPNKITVEIDAIFAVRPEWG